LGAIEWVYELYDPRRRDRGLNKSLQ